MLNKFESMEEYKKVFGISKMKLESKDAIKLIKIKDLIAFANSIIEIMVAKHEHGPSHINDAPCK
jgi:hypothetical protein